MKPNDLHSVIRYEPLSMIPAQPGWRVVLKDEHPGPGQTAFFTQPVVMWALCRVTVTWHDAKGRPANAPPWERDPLPNRIVPMTIGEFGLEPTQQEDDQVLTYASPDQSDDAIATLPLVQQWVQMRAASGA
jgi:hypothetical protein